MIREATQKDIDAVYQLWCELMDFHRHHHPVFGYHSHAEQTLKNELAHRLGDLHTKFFVAEDDGALTGMIITHFGKISEGYQFSRKGYIAETIIREKYRGTGIGKQLFDRAKKWLMEMGADHIELQASVKNPEAIAFWEARGFSAATQHMIMILKRTT